MKSLSIIIILSTALLLFSKGEIYFGIMLFVFSYFWLISIAASSPYGDMSKTPDEIKAAIIQARKEVEVDINYLSYPEQVAMKEKYRQQGITERVQKQSKARRCRRFYYPVNNCNSSCRIYDDDNILTSPPNDMFEHDDDYFIYNTLSENDAIEETYVNPTTGMIMIGGIGGIDAGGHFWCESDSFDDSFSDSFSSIDDSFSLDDSSDCFSTGMDDW